jgi:hypothetical protein
VNFLRKKSIWWNSKFHKSKKATNFLGKKSNKFCPENKNKNCKFTLLDTTTLKQWNNDICKIFSIKELGPFMLQLQVVERGNQCFVCIR